MKTPIRIIVLRSKDACPSVEGRMSFGRGTHVLRSGDAHFFIGMRQHSRPFEICSSVAKKKSQVMSQRNAAHYLRLCNLP